MSVIAVLAPGPASAVLRRSMPRAGVRLVRCRGADALWRLASTRLLDAVILSPLGAGFAVLRDVREQLPALPVVAWAPFRADDGEALAACREGGVAALVVEGVDDAVAGELVSRATLAAERRRLLADGPRVLRLTEPLQRRAWDLVVRDVEVPLRTEQIASRLRVSREHLSRQFGAGGAPNLKRVIDLARVACAAQLLQNPRTPPPVVAEILRYASPSHLAATVRRIADVAVAELAELGPQGVLAAFVRGRTRSRL